MPQLRWPEAGTHGENIEESEQYLWILEYYRDVFIERALSLRQEQMLLTIRNSGLSAATPLYPTMTCSMIGADLERIDLPCRKMGDPAFFLTQDFTRLLTHLRAYSPIHWRQAWPPLRLRKK